ncbi:MAG: hypothetical protein DBX59_12180, partial [Bacillota bacterium]
MVNKISLNGEYKLYCFDENETFSLQTLKTKEHIRAIAPCNVETALTAAGKLADIYRRGTEEAKKYERSSWCFAREFTVKKGDEKIFLEFEGVDTFFTCYLNGKPAGEGKNALIFHRFDVTELIESGNNTLVVYISSTLKKAFEYENSPVTVPCLAENAESLHIRKPAYQFGWDIFPRILSAGLTGDINLICERGVNLKKTFLSTQYVEENSAGLQFFYDIDMPAADYGKYRLRLSLSCKDSSYEYEIPVGFRSGTKYLFLQNPCLWWTNGMGEQNLYA